MLNEFFRKWALWISFAIALASASGSLYTSEVLGIVPCTSCWYIRIMMYPLVFILAVSAWKKSRYAFDYVIPFCILGFAIGIWQFSNAPSFNELILLLPLLSALSFAAIALLTFIYKRIG